jgi:hypothetical protein
MFRGPRSLAPDQQETLGYMSLLQNSIETEECVRARLQSRRKSNKTMLGFSACGFCFQAFAIPQRLKPESKLTTFGTTEVVP